VAAEQRERDREREREQEAARARARENEAEKKAAYVPAPSTDSWLIPPDRAATFEPPVADASPRGPTTRVYPIYAPPAEPAWTPDPPPALPRVEVEPVAGAAPVLAPISSPTTTASIPMVAGSIRLKDDVSLWTGPRARGESRQEPESLSAADAYTPFSTIEPPRPVPWKLIAAGVVLIATTFAITRGYTPDSVPLLETTGKGAPAAGSSAAPPPAAPPVSGNSGQLAITSQPPGARVTIDGKAAGETPLTLDTVRPGRHVIILTGASGASAKRTVRVEAGQTLAIDLPLFSGFAAISAPFVIEVSENGKTLGTSEDQILLSPGSHALRVANKDLGYVATETVEIQPGEVTRLTLDPRGRANINAAPWAEVWIDGEKAGETPLANVAIRLGIREIVFKNPQFGERKITATITGSAPATISVDFSK